MDVVKDHLIPHLYEKMAKEMFDPWLASYRSENINRKMILQNKLRAIEMISSDSITSFFLQKQKAKFVFIGCDRGSLCT